MDINRTTTTIDVGKGGGYTGDKFFHTSTPSLRYNTGKNVNVDPDNINTDIHTYIHYSFFDWNKDENDEEEESGDER